MSKPRYKPVKATSLCNGCEFFNENPEYPACAIEGLSDVDCTGVIFIKVEEGKDDE